MAKLTPSQTVERRQTPSSFQSRYEIGNYFSRDLDSFYENSQDEFTRSPTQQLSQNEDNSLRRRSTIRVLTSSSCQDLEESYDLKRSTIRVSSRFVDHATTSEQSLRENNTKMQQKQLGRRKLDGLTCTKRDVSLGSNDPRLRGLKTTKATRSPKVLSPLFQTRRRFSRLHRILQDNEDRKSLSRCDSLSIVEFNLDEDDQQLYLRKNLAFDQSSDQDQDTHESSSGLLASAGSVSSPTNNYQADMVANLLEPTRPPGCSTRKARLVKRRANLAKRTTDFYDFKVTGQQKGSQMMNSDLDLDFMEDRASSDLEQSGTQSKTSVSYQTNCQEKSDSRELQVSSVATSRNPNLSKICEERSEHEQSLMIQQSLTIDRCPSFSSSSKPNEMNEVLESIVKKLSSDRNLDVTLFDDVTTGSSRRHARQEKREIGQQLYNQFDSKILTEPRELKVIDIDSSQVS